MDLHWFLTSSSVLDECELRSGARLTTDIVERAIEDLTWLPPDATDIDRSIVPAILDTILDYRLAGVTRVAASAELAPHGFFGIEATLRSAGRFRLFALEQHGTVFPLCRSLTLWRAQFASRSPGTVGRDGRAFRVADASPSRVLDGVTMGPTYRVVFDDLVECDAAPAEVLDLSDG